MRSVDGSKLRNARPTSSEHLGRQVGVHRDRGDPGVDQAAHGGHVPRPLGDGPAQRQLDEELLALHPGEVAAHVGVPATVGVLHLEVLADPGEPEGLPGAEDPAPGLGDVELDGRPRADRVREVHGHAVDDLDQLAEPGEVHLEVVVDRDAVGLADRGDQQLGPAGLEQAVDPAARPAPRRLDHEVAGERQEVGLTRAGVEPQHHQRVGQVRARRAAGHIVVGVEPGGVVDAHHEDVGRLAAGGVEVGEDPVAEVVAADLGDALVGVRERGRERGGREQGQHVDGDDEALGPGAPGAGRPRAAGAPGRHHRATIPGRLSAPAADRGRG